MCIRDSKHMQIEKIYLAPETASKNPKQWEALKEVFPEDKVEWVMLKDHEQLKACLLYTSRCV